MRCLIFFIQNSRMMPKTKQCPNLFYGHPHPWGVSLATTTSPDSPNTKVKEEGQLNVFVVEEVVVTGGMGQVQEAPVILIPGICQVHPDPDLATVTLGLGNKNP